MTLLTKLSIYIFLLLITITVVTLANQQNNELDLTIHNNEPGTTTTATATATIIKTAITPTVISTTNDKEENESLAMVILINAGLIAFSFFRLVGSSIYNIITTLLLPIYYLISFCWRNMVTRPFALLMNIGHALYPVFMYCLAAICCGTLIGACAGFATEAIASFTISATWGRSSSSSTVIEQQQKHRRRSRRQHKSMNNNDSYYDYLDQDDAYDYGSQDEISTTTTQSEISSQWDPSFFGEQQSGTKGKERVDHWDQTLLSRTSTESSITPRPLSQHQQPSSSLSSMMPMSPMNNSNTTLKGDYHEDRQDAMDDWAWDDDDDQEELEEHPRLRRRSVIR
ncbi:hypothetical protein BDC45DRAFT_502708 [Circinella umbellata]|nr:hypothetical protein BDC45DRAFT_502708 [Circinella umbellata]